MAIGCPDPRRLVQLGTPSVGDATFQRYDQHLEICPACQAVLREFVDDGLDSPALPAADLLIHEDFPHISGFTIERELGRGAMGVVYLATQDEIGRRVALKLVTGGHAAGERERRRWLREAEAASRVHHPQIVTLYGFGEACPWFYLVLEFIPGGTLKNRLTGPIPSHDAAKLVESVARAVGQLHRQGIYHLDLKPSNILLEGDENTPWGKVVPKVSDFSIARLVGDGRVSLSTGIPLGTPAYMSPEQAGRANVAIGPHSDVYAVGAILYELLTGRPPIERISIAETLEAIGKQDPIAPRRLNPAVSRDLETICLKCVQKTPARRYASAEAFADDLNRCLDGRPIAARPVSFLEKAWRASRRRPVVATLAVSLAVSLVGGLVGMFLLWRNAEAERNRAEADYKIAMEIVEQNVALTAGGDYISKFKTQSDFIETLERSREGLLKVAASRPNRPTIYDRIAFLDQRLGHLLLLKGRWHEAHTVLEESLYAYDRVIAGNPLDDVAHIYRIATLQYLASVFEKEGRHEQRTHVLDLAVAAREHLLSSDYLRASIRERGNQNQLSNSIVVRPEPEDLVAMAWRICARFGCDRICEDPIAVPGSISPVAGPGRARGTPSSGGDRPAAANEAERDLESLDWAVNATCNRSQIAKWGYLHVLHVAEIAAE